ncbi:MAG: hypothetical protein LBQ57_10740, partial [Spirochaetales bacterium]|nr:hypothetical protein [Spirochaetales bacterium]
MFGFVGRLALKGGVQFGCTNFFRVKSPEALGPRQGLQRKSFWHRQKIEAESPVFCMPRQIARVSVFWITGNRARGPKKPFGVY